MGEEAPKVLTPLLEAVKSGSMIKVESVLRTHANELDSVDENGMTPLEFACYRGDLKMVKLLVENGANINSNRHVHGYTALMFAALGGHTDIVQYLLEAGADVEKVNSVGRNASQMAAFVGQHATATLIINFIPSKALQPYTTGPTPLLRNSLLEPLLTFVRTRNIHPVYLVLMLKEKKVLLEESASVIKTLDQMCKNEMTKSDPNEPNALKFHILSNLVDYTQKNVTISDEASFESCMKKLLRNESESGLPLLVEKALRNAVREFPFKDSTIFLQLLKSLAEVKIGDEPSALTLLTRMVSGVMSDNDTDHRCNSCHQPNSPKKCSQCGIVSYCNQFCQKIHWPCHKKTCNKATSTAQKIQIIHSD